MQKVPEWWRLPRALSFFLGFTPAMYAVLGALYGFGEKVTGGLVVLVVVLVLIWLPAFIALGIRHLREK